MLHWFYSGGERRVSAGRTHVPFGVRPGTPGSAVSGQARTDPAFGNIYDHFTVEYQYANGIHVMRRCHSEPQAKDPACEREVFQPRGPDPSLRCAAFGMTRLAQMNQNLCHRCESALRPISTCTGAAADGGRRDNRCTPCSPSRMQRPARAAARPASPGDGTSYRTN